jgi:hypothetical protein
MLPPMERYARQDGEHVSQIVRRRSGAQARWLSHISSGARFGDLSVKPDFGFGQVDIITPDDPVTVRIGTGASEDCFILQRAKDIAVKEGGAVIYLLITVFEGDQ